MYTEIEILEPLLSVMQACEVHCEVGCCGMDAFDISPQWIRGWLEKNDPSLLDMARQQIDDIIERLESIEGNVEIPYFGWSDTAEGWIPTFNEFREGIEKAPSASLPEPRVYTPQKGNSISEALPFLGCAVLCAIPVAGVITLVRWLIEYIWTIIKPAS